MFSSLSKMATTAGKRKRSEREEIRTDNKRQITVSSYFIRTPETRAETSHGTGSETSWGRVIRNRDLELRYGVVYAESEADELFARIDQEVEFNQDRVFVFGKWHPIPRRQAAYGDDGLMYAFSGTRVSARPWTPLLLRIKEDVERLAQQCFNFVLINRYQDGNDHIGEHRDDEKELCPTAAIASLSLGQPRDFRLVHADARRGSRRGSGSASAQVSPLPVSLVLEHGSLLLMLPPTNRRWYHSLPVRKKATRPRLNLTFRRLLIA